MEYIYPIGYTKKSAVAILIMILLALFVGLLLVGCIPGMKGVKPVSEMSPTERAAWALKVYKAEFADYQNALGYEHNPGTKKWDRVRTVDLTPKQKEFYSQKKALLTQAYAIVSAYAKYVDTGTVPTKALEDQLIDKIDELIMKQLE